jgi:hypothetical protein
LLAPGWTLEFSGIEVPADWNLIVPDSDNDLDSSDLENVKIVYGALKELTPTQATDPVLWVYLTHVQFWSYMRKRYPLKKYLARPKVTNDSTYKWISNHYHLPSIRALTLNGIARLWWYGYTSHDENRDNPWELTEFLLSDDLDTAAQVFERNFGRNRIAAQAFLAVVQQQKEDGALSELSKSSDRRDAVRRLAIDTTLLAGVAVLDLLGYDELVGLLTEKIQGIVATEFV